MSEHHLKVAKEFIQDKDYASAKKVLSKIPDHPTAKKWLARIKQIEQPGETIETALEPVTLPPHIKAIVKNRLSQGEQILWYEQPDPVIYGKYLNPNWRIVYFIIIGCTILVPEIFAQFSTFKRDGSFFSFTIFAALFLIAAPFISIPIMQKYATNIHYIVTDRRGFIIEKRKVKALNSEDTAKMRIIEEKAGFKSLIFYQYYGLLNLIRGKIPLGFLGISEADDVKRIIDQHWYSGS